MKCAHEKPPLLLQRLCEGWGSATGDSRRRAAVLRKVPSTVYPRYRTVKIGHARSSPCGRHRARHGDRLRVRRQRVVAGEHMVEPCLLEWEGPARTPTGVDFRA